MADTVLLRSTRTITAPQCRKLGVGGDDPVMNGGTVAMFDAAQYVSDWTTLTEKVSGRAISAGGAWNMTLAGGMMKVPSAATGFAGLSLGYYNSTIVGGEPPVDLSVGDASNMLFSMWFRVDGAIDGNERALCYVGASNPSEASKTNQFLITARTTSGADPKLKFRLAGAVVGGEVGGLSLGQVYQLAANVITTPSSAKIVVYISTPSTLNLTPVATFPVSFSGFGSLASGGAVIGVAYDTIPPLSVLPSNCSIGRFVMERLSVSGRDAQRQIARDWKANAARWA